MAIPKAPVNRIIKEAGAERVSDAAVVALVEYLEADAAAVAKKAIEYAKIAKRQTVKADDIKLAIGIIEKFESDHNLDITYNFGPNRDGVITAGIDIHRF